MERILIKDLHTHVGKPVLISGWVEVRRDQGKMVFFDFRDRSGRVQGVVLPKSQALEAAKMIRHEDVVSAEGILNKRPEKNIQTDKQNGDIELEIKSIGVVSKAHDLPFELGTEVNPDTHLDHLPYTLRSEKSKDVFRVQATIIEAFREALRSQDFIEFQSPVLVGEDAEGGAAAFKVDYYRDKKAYLATSPQLYKQIMTGVFERVFATAKVFRAEKHATPRHVSEVLQMDFEMAFIEDHRDIMAMLERVVRSIALQVAKRHADVLSRFNVEAPLLPKETFPALKLREAQELLGIPAALDLEPEHERRLSEWAKREKGSDFVFVTHFPFAKRPFYTYEDEKDPGYTKYFDLLFRGLEINSGGQRVHQYDRIIENLKKKGLDPQKFAYYLQTFKYGMPPHGGCSTGLERLTARMLGLPNIREATLFPRDMNRIDARLSEEGAP